MTDLPVIEGWMLTSTLVRKDKKTEEQANDDDDDEESSPLKKQKGEVKEEDLGMFAADLS